MKINELRAKNVDDLNKELHSLLKAKFSLKMQQALGETPKSHQFKEIKRNIARINTILTEKVREPHE